ncbi:restriction endonuclease [Actinomadura barringtoniae]|uniref:Restriction endonuclease n=1 Tax=Actinomadura barringtoniae TaxID=1427535 RepID=A0A939T9B4_9ACTN|nr:restriction endonuclease [Actinomadura barringtoniae]MBO2451192.1 restriction endonuclease [Actinomadura barringtoniae]
MARGSGSSGSYRDWEAARKAEQRAQEQAAKRREQERKAQEREQAQAEAIARDQEAAALTARVEQRAGELDGLLRSSLAWDPRIPISSLRRQPNVPPLDLGRLAGPLPSPDWDDFAPQLPGGLGRLFGGRQRYESELEAAEHAYAQALDDHRRRDSERQKKVVDARRAHERAVQEAGRSASEFNAHLDAMAAGLEEGDRHAVSEYMEIVLQNSPYPEGFSDERRAGFVPESSLLAVEWYLPPVEIVPDAKAYRHIKTRKAVEPTPRPMPEIRQIYQRIIAQIALRTLREVFGSAPTELITTIVFNGRVHAVDPVTGQRIQPYLVTLRATREQFERLVLHEPKFNPVECIRRHFFADVSPHPDELIPVEPVMPFEMADPRAVDAIDVISGIDKRPNLLDLKPKEFEAFVQNLFTKMGFDTQLFRASGDGGVDCVAYDPHPISGGKFIVQAKLYTKTVAPTHVRDLWGTVQHEGATKGIMITTSGYGPDSFKFANGKPLNLIDGHGLLSLCHQHGIPARILGLPKRSRPASAPKPGTGHSPP